MKRFMIAVLLITILALAQAGKHHKKNREEKEEKHRKKHHKEEVAMEAAKEALDHLQFKEAQVADDGSEEDEDEDEEEEEKIKGYENDVLNPCVDWDCPMGKVCTVTANWKPMCVCVEECPLEEDEAFHVCATNNHTYNSDCELYRLKCSNRDYENVQLDYYGDCREFEPCEGFQQEEFPLRMRDWFWKTMEQLAELSEEEGGLTEWERKIEEIAKVDPKKYIKPIHWKFNTLDVNPVDGYLDPEELMPLRAPLQRLEHCTKPFIKLCDENKDELISLLEWAKCLKLDEDDLNYFNL